MNLHGIVRGVITAVNPDVVITLKRSNGYTTALNGKQTPLYDAPVTGPAQIQPMGKSDLRHMAELNIQGVFRTVYLYGNWFGIVRADKTGGDVLTFWQATGRPASDWKIVDVPEIWPDWCRVSVVMQ
jgi:hypothetical protein